MEKTEQKDRKEECVVLGFLLSYSMMEHSWASLQVSLVSPPFLRDFHSVCLTVDVWEEKACKCRKLR